MSERSVSVRLLAITSQYDAAMRNSGRVTTDLGTQAQLSGAQVDNLGQRISTAQRAADSAKPSFSALGMSIAGLGPALIPIGAAAAGVGGALGLMGAAGVFAFKGIEAEMSAGTGKGKVYTDQLALLHTNLLDLERTAAAGIMGPFVTAVDHLEQQMPFLNGMVGEFAGLLGHSAGNLLDGVISGLHTMMPLFQDAALMVEDLSGDFKSWSAGGGFQSFVDYARAELPVVEHVLTEVATALAHLVAGLEPVGGAALGALGVVATAINALPVSTLKTVIPLLVDAYLAMKAYQGLTLAATAVGAFATRLTASGTAAKAAAAATAAGATATEASLAAEAAAAEQAAAAITLESAQQAAAAAQAAAAVEGAGAIEQAVMEATAASAAEAAAAYEAASATTVAAAEAQATAVAGAATATRAAGAASTLAASSAFGPMGLAIGAVTVALGAGLFAWQKHTQAVEADKEQVRQLSDALVNSKGIIDATTVSLVAQNLQKNGTFDWAKTAGINLDTLTQAALGNQSAMKQLLAGQKAVNDALGASTAGIGGNPLVGQAQGYDAVIKAVTAENAKLTDAQKVQQDLAAATGQATDATSQQTLALNGATDAADAFTTALTGISTAAGGDVVRSQDALQKQLNAVADALHTAKGAIDQYSNAGLDSRDAIDQSATSAQAYAAQVYKQTGSINDAVTAYDAWYVALVNTAKSQGLSKAQLDAYLASVGQLPSQVNQALATMTTVGQNASANLVNGAIAGVNGNAGRLTAIGAAAGANVGFGFTTSLFSAVNNAFAAIGTLALTARGGSTSSTFNEQVPGTPTSVIKAYTPPKLAVGSTSPVIKGGTYTPPKAAGGSKSAKTPAQTAHDNAVAADDLWAAKALAAISPTNKLALAQEAVAEAQRRLANETKKGTTEYYQDLTKLHQAQSDLTAEVLAEAQARAQAQKQLAADEKSYADLLGKEADTTAKYYSDLNSLAAAHAAKDQQLLAQRQSDIEGFASANQKAVIQWGSSLSFLTGNVEDQADQITKWSKLLAEARAKGVSEAVISALGLDQGPQALGQLEQFSNATQDQIDALNKAVADKNAAAGQEVTTEAANNYGALGQALLAEQQSYADSVKALQTQFIADMEELAKEAQQAQTAINGDKATMVNGVYTDTATGRAAFYGPNGEPGSATKTAYYSAAYTMPDGRVAYYHPGDVAASQSYNSVPAGKPVAFSNNSIQAQVAPTFTTPQVRVFIGDTELKGMVRVEMSQANAEKKQSILVGGVR